MTEIRTVVGAAGRIEPARVPRARQPRTRVDARDRLRAGWCPDHERANVLSAGGADVRDEAIEAFWSEDVVVSEAARVERWLATREEHDLGRPLSVRKQHGNGVCVRVAKG